MRTSVPILLCVAAACWLGGCTQTAEPTATSDQPVAEAKTPKELQWAASYDDAMKQAKKETRNVMIKFYADWCGPCKQMEEEAFKDPEVIAALKDVIPVRVDGEAPENRPLMEKYRVSGYPCVLFVNGDSIPFGRIEGYKNKAWFLEGVKHFLP